MATRSWILRLTAALVCACMIITSFSSVALAASGNVVRLDGNTSVPSQATLLAGNDSTLIRSTLADTIREYEKTYMLGVASDFCVFLEDYFWVTESDAEGRVAVGGNFYIDASWGISYTVGAGDFYWHTPLDELFVDSKLQQNRLGAATVILGGNLYGNLNDTYYAPDSNKIAAHQKSEEAWDTGDIDMAWRMKWEGEGSGKYDSYDNHGNVVRNAAQQSSKKLVINKLAGSDVSTFTSTQNFPVTSYWSGTATHTDNTNKSFTPVPGDNSGKAWQKIYQNQTYVTDLLNFSSQFAYLREISTRLAGVDNEFTVTTATTHANPNGSGRINNEPGLTTIIFTYTGDSNINRDCVYLTLSSAKDLEAFQTASYVEFVGVPNLTEYREIVEVKNRYPGVTYDNTPASPRDQVYLEKWYPAYIIINVMAENASNKTIHIADLSKANGQKFTSINGRYISRSSATDTDASKNNHAGVTSLLYNFPDASTVILGNNFQGTIFAPNAHVTDEFTEENFKDQYSENNAYKTQPQYLRGHLSGALIAKSFKGATEFGYRPFTGPFDIVTGNLKISKTVQGTTSNPSQLFHFTVQLGNTNINGKYGDMEFVRGKADVYLTAGKSATATGLLSGTTYTITETATDHYQIGIIGEKEGVKQATGSIEAGDTAEVEFVNTYIEDDDDGNGDNNGNDDNTGDKDDNTDSAKGSLTVSKKVRGGETGKSFNFTVNLNDRNINGTYGQMTFTNGIAYISLTDGESKTAQNLPAGLKYTVTETKDPDYTVSKTGDSGTIVGGKKAEAVFVNTYNDKTVTAPQTGDSFPLYAWLALMVIALAGLTMNTRFVRKDRKN